MAKREKTKELQPRISHRPRSRFLIRLLCCRTRYHFARVGPRTCLGACFFDAMTSKRTYMTTTEKTQCRYSFDFPLIDSGRHSIETRAFKRETAMVCLGACFFDVMTSKRTYITTTEKTQCRYSFDFLLIDSGRHSIETRAFERE